MATDLHRERLFQEIMDKEPKRKWFSWKVLQQAKLALGATTYIGNTALTATPYFENAVRGVTILWVPRASSPRVINWTGLSREDQAATLPSRRPQAF